MSRYLPASVTLLVRAFLNPSSYIGGRSSVYERGAGVRAKRAIRLIALYIVGIVLYALPLTYAGIGAAEATEEPHPIALTLAEPLGWDGAELWLFVSAFIENSMFLIVGSVLVFVVLHVAVVLLGTSDGLLQTVHTVVYATGMYLAAIYSFVWALSIADGVRVADEVVLAIQASFVTTTVELTGTGFELPGGTTPMPETTAITPLGRLLLIGLALACIYFLYSIYLGVRINHDGSRSAALGVVALVLAAPALYVIGSVAVILFTNA